MTTLLALVLALFSAQTDEGCGMDPNGGCVGGLSAVSGDKGLGVDPNG